jgi:hypothetical protein
MQPSHQDPKHIEFEKNYSYSKSDTYQVRDKSASEIPTLEPVNI